MYPRIKDYSLGDLIVFVESLEWEGTSCIEGEIGIVIEIYEQDDEVNFFDLLIQLSDGGMIPVWCPEVEKLEDAGEI